MFKIISIHSFRRGTGKSSLVANFAALLAALPPLSPSEEESASGERRRVCAIDTNIQSPSLPLLFGLDDAKIQYTLNDYLLGRCEIEQAAYNISQDLWPSSQSSDIGQETSSNKTLSCSPKVSDRGGAVSEPGNIGRETASNQARGEILLVPASTRTGDITQILRKGYDINLLYEGLQRLVKILDLDIMIIDTHAGLNEETLPLMALADDVIVLLRPDPQEYQGTAVMIDITQQLEVPNVRLLVNQVPMGQDQADPATFASLTAHVKSQVEQTYKQPVLAVLPASDDIMTLASSRSRYQTGIFVLHHPHHPITTALRQATYELLKD